MKRSRSQFTNVLFALSLLAASVAVLASPLPAQAATVWEGPTVEFTKADYADWTLEVNQDRITDIVWITRGDNRQIFNIFPTSGETYGQGFGSWSPLGTTWAWQNVNNPNDPAEITASNWESLYFGRFDEIYNIPDVTSRAAVVHLISEDIYLNIQFTSWSSGNSGGGFSYVRTAEPASDLTWTGGISDEWSTNLVNNWKDPAGDPAPYADGLSVMFDNSNPGSAIVTITNGNVAPSSVTFNNSAIGVATYTLTGIDANGITGDTGLTKRGSGTLIIQSANTYTGTTTLTLGTLNLGVAEDVDVSGPLGKQSADAAGTIILKGGTLQYSAANQNDYSGRFSTADNQAYNVDTNDQDVTWAAALTSLGGSLAKTGTGTLTLSGENTYEGATTIGAGGTLNLANSLALQNSTLDYADAGGLVAFDAAITEATFGGLTGDKNLVLENADSAPVALTVGQNSADTEYYGNLNGTGSLIKVGTGRLTLNTNEYDGNTTIREGILRTRTAESIGTGKIIFEGGTLQYRNHSTDISGRIEAIADGQTAKIDTNGNDVSFGTAISGEGGLSKLGDGTLTLSVANTYDGDTTISGGNLQIAALDRLGGGNITFQGGTLQSISTLDVSGRINDVAGGQVARIDTNGNDVQFDTAITGDGGLTKLGDGALTLGAAVPAGPTTVSGGALNIGSATGTLATLNVPTGGTANLGLNAAVTQLNVTGGTVNTTDTGVTVNTATLSAGTVNASAANALAVTDTLTTGSGIKMAYTGGGSFTASGANVSDDSAARTLTLSGGVLSISSTAVKATDLPSGVTVWLDASSIAGKANGDAIDTWADKSGIGNDATQTDTARKPTFVASSGLNGQPAVRFTNPGDAGQRMQLGDLNTQFGGGAATLLVVSTINSDGRYNLFGNRDNDSRWVADSWGESQPGDFKGGRTNFDGANPYALWPQTGNHLFSLESNTELYRMVIDGATIGQTGPEWNNGAGQDWTIGDRAQNGDGGQALNGDIAEFLLFNTALTADEMNNVGGYLATKYGITSDYTGGIVGVNPVDLPNTAIDVTSNSELALATGNNKLGKLTVSGSSTVLTLSGATTVSFNGLAGDGTVLGTVIIPEGGEVSPGSSIGTVTASGLTLEDGSLLTFEIADDSGDPGSIDQIIVTDDGGLTINGGLITLLDSTGENTFSTLGTYNLIGYAGDIGGSVSNLYVVNKIPDTKYTFGAAGDFVTLTIANLGYWNGAGADANWSTTANWNGTDPVTGDVLVFRKAGAGGATLNNDLISPSSFASLQFDANSSLSEFVLTGNAITLTGDGPGKTIIVNNSGVTQTVNLDIALGTNGKIDANSGNIAVGGNISGDGYGLTKTGDNKLTLSGTNTYTGATTVSAGTLQLDGSLTGTGGLVTVSGGAALNVAAGSSIARDVTVSGGAMSHAGTLTAGTTLTLTSGSIATAEGPAKVASADFSAGEGTVTANIPLTITSTLKVPGITAAYTAGGSATAFTVEGSNIVDSTLVRTITLSGGTLAMVVAPPGPPVAGYAAWYDASQLSYGNGETVTTWADLSGNGHTATTNVGTPVMATDQVNGLPAVQFRGESLNAAGELFAKEHYYVFRSPDPTWSGYGAVFGHQDTGPRGSAYIFYPDWTGFWNDRAPESVSKDGTLVEANFNGNASYDLVKIDDYMVLKVVVDDNNPTPVAHSIGGWGNEFLANMDIAEIIIFDRALNADEESLVGGYLAGKYNIGTAYTPFGGGGGTKTNLTVTSMSTLVLPAGTGTQLGTLTLVGGVELAIDGAYNVHFTGLTGNGSVLGTVVIPRGGLVSPGESIGVINVSGLTLESGSLLTFEIDSTTDLDQIFVTDRRDLVVPSGGLEIQGGAITLILTGEAASELETYNLIRYVGGIIGDISELSVTNEAPLGVKYTIADARIPGKNAGFVTLTVGLAGYWMGGGGTDANWSNSDNWNTVPPVEGDVLLFVTAGDDGGGGEVLALNNDLASGRSYASLEFYGGAPAFVLEGNSIELTGDGPDKIIIKNNSTAKQTVNMDIALGANGKIDISDGDIEVGGAISGDYSLTKTGAGTLTLSGDNTYTGPTAITAGTLSLTGSLTNTAITINAGTLDIGGAGRLGVGGTYSSTITIAGGATFRYNSSSSFAVSGSIDGEGSVIKDGAGTLTMSSTTGNTFSGGTIVNEGILQANCVDEISYNPLGALGSGDVTVNNGGTIEVLFHNSLVGYYSSSLQTTTINSGGLITSLGALTNHLKRLVMNGGVLNATEPEPNYGSWMFDEGVSTPGNGTSSLISGGNASLAQGGGTVFNIGATDTLTISTVLDYNNQAGDTGLIKSGPGLLILSAANAYRSDTTVTEGTLQIAGAGSLGTGDYAGNITNNATFLYSSSAAQTLSGVISGSGSLTKDTDSASTLTLSGANSYTGDTTVSAGTLILDDAAEVPGQLKFIITGTGETTNSNKITGAGTVQLDGDFIFDMAAAGDTMGDTWTIVDVDTLAAAIFGDTFTLVDFTGGEGAGVLWSKPITSSKIYEFSEATGILMVKLALGGDTNSDGVVDAVDYIALKTNFGVTEGATLAMGNFDVESDGNVDWDDLKILMANFGARSGGGAPAATPEPATLGLLAIGALAVLRRRRRA